MSSSIQLAADATTLNLDGSGISDFAEGDFITLTPVNPSTGRVNAAGGGVTVHKRMDGDVYDMVLRVQEKSASDVLLNSWERQPKPKILDGSIKEAFCRDGADAAESWILADGSITTKPTKTKNNTDGAAMMEYTIQFRSAARNL